VAGKPEVKRVLYFIVPFLMVSGASGASAGASEYGVDYYMAPPMVQGSYVSGYLQDFNDTNSCPTTDTDKGVTVDISGDCSISSSGLYGGASVVTSTPTAGGDGSNYAYNDDPITLTISSPMCYLGFWWSAGSDGNVVDFYDGDTEVLSLSSDDIIDLLDPTDGPTLSSIGPTVSTYPKRAWFGNPRFHTDAQAPFGIPDDEGDINPNEPFVYLHILAQGGLRFDTVVLSGSGFEFDNLVISSRCQNPRSNLVSLGSVDGTPPPGFVPPREGRTPSIDLDRYLDASSDESVLPNTGRSNSGLEWIAAAFVAIGTIVLGAQRRLRRV
jgi:hypothetical protein